jgi:hypothetical protein
LRHQFHVFLFGRHAVPPFVSGSLSFGFARIIGEATLYRKIKQFGDG